MKDMIQEVINQILAEIPSFLKEDADEAELLMKQGKYREAYLKLYEIKKNPIWSPTNIYLQLIEKFWWDYAN